VLLAGAACAGWSAGALGASAVGFSSGVGNESELGNMMSLLADGSIRLVATVLPVGRRCGGDKYTGIGESSPAVVAWLAEGIGGGVAL
jgi:hypothetical protein